MEIKEIQCSKPLTTDAKYLATTEATRELCFIRNLFEWLQVDFDLLVPMYRDNTNANSYRAIFPPIL